MKRPGRHGKQPFAAKIRNGVFSFQLPTLRSYVIFKQYAL